MEQEAELTVVVAPIVAEFAKIAVTVWTETNFSVVGSIHN
jgi:hypothetical protein